MVIRRWTHEMCNILGYVTPQWMFYASGLDLHSPKSDHPLLRWFTWMWCKYQIWQIYGTIWVSYIKLLLNRILYTSGEISVN